MNNKNTMFSQRFRGLLPIVIDIETSGLNPKTDAILEIAAVTLKLTADGIFTRDKTLAYHVEPFKGAKIHPQSLEITGIDPYYPLRFAIPEMQMLYRLFAFIREALDQTGCYRGVLVGHNAWFDLSFILEAKTRSGLRYNPLHSFTTIDTASLAALHYGETVLARALKKARIPFNMDYAHSAIYDALKTADLFCHILNQFGRLG